MKKKRIVVLGAGVTGLAAAYKLSQRGHEVHVVDKNPEAGGTCQSFSEGDFRLDYGPHKFYTLVDGVLDDLKELMGDELLERDKAQSLYMHGKYFAYPLKMSEMLLRFPPFESVKILFSYIKQVFSKKGRSATYEEFIVERFGRGLYRQIFEPMAKKIYGDPTKLDKKLAEVRISSPGLMSVIKQLLFRSNIDKTIQAPQFHYPKSGFGRIPDRLWEESTKNGATFHMESSIQQLHMENGQVTSVEIETFGKKKTIECDQVVYTIPLSFLPRLMPNVPEEIRESAANIRYRHVVIYYYLLRSKPVLPSMWVFFPEDKFRFGRLSEMTKFSPFVAPKDQTALMVDFTCLENDPYWKMSDEELGTHLDKELEELKLFGKDQVIRRFSKRIKNFYPIYDVGFQKHLENIRKLEKSVGNLFFIGRLGDFNYNNSDQCLDMGYQAANHIDAETPTDWESLRTERFDQYRIVD